MYNPVSQPYNPKGFGKGGGQFGNQAITNKGGGKGYQGSCWTCGMVGHKSAECQTRRTNLVEAEEEEADAGTKEIGGVWLMGHVDKIKTTNRFQALTRIEEENQDGDETQEGQDHRPKTSKGIASRVESGGKFDCHRMFLFTQRLNVQMIHPQGNRSHPSPTIQIQIGRFMFHRNEGV